MIYHLYLIITLLFFGCSSDRNKINSSNSNIKKEDSGNSELKFQIKNKAKEKNDINDDWFDDWGTTQHECLLHDFKSSYSSLYNKIRSSNKKSEFKNEYKNLNKKLKEFMEERKDWIYNDLVYRDIKHILDEINKIKNKIELIIE